MARSGKFRQRATIVRFQPDGGVDANNHPTGTDQPLRTVNCSIRGMGGTTDEHARQQVHQAMFEMKCRWFPDLQLTDQISHHSRTFEIAHINNVDMRDKDYTITLQEVQSSQ